MFVTLVPNLPTDSENYEVLTEGVDRVRAVDGLTCEIGLRRGGGTRHILDAIATSNQQKVHIAIDPYGNIEYPEGADDCTVRCDYTNAMRDEALTNLYLYCLQNNHSFIFFNLEDTEFFARYSDGVPVYQEHKQLWNRYAFVHFDGPHTAQCVRQEVEFFNPRSPRGAVWVFDDVALYDHQKIHTYIESLGWSHYRETPKKWAYVKLRDL